jgi:uncharacterized damage-inducible protein DinB
MKKDYRKGAVGALMDEYERAAFDLMAVIELSSEVDFSRILDADTKDEDCRSMQTIITHVVRAGYAYANYIREELSIATIPIQSRHLSQTEAVSEIERMLEYTADTLRGRWEMSDEEMDGVKMETRWGMSYNLEQMMEHAIVHILRHRRQIERLIQSNEMR